MKNKFDFEKIIREVRVIMKNLPTEIAVTLEQAVDNNFKTESFFGSKWEKRKRISRSDKKNKAKRNLLVDSGALRRDMTNAKVQGNEVKVESELPYAAVHNEGEGKIPQRKFIDHSPELDKQIKKKIEKELDRMFK